MGGWGDRERGRWGDGEKSDWLLGSKMLPLLIVLLLLISND